LLATESTILLAFLCWEKRICCANRVCRMCISVVVCDKILAPEHSWGCFQISQCSAATHSIRRLPRKRAIYGHNLTSTSPGVCYYTILCRQSQPSGIFCCKKICSHLLKLW